MAHLTLITGGSRSGKSAHALELAREGPGADTRRFFLATAQALDEEMRARIEHHRAARRAEFETVEEPLALLAAVSALDRRADVLVLDSLTLWIANLIGASMSDQAIMAEAGALAEALRQARFISFVVTDEVGCGIVPEHPLGRRFRDLLGQANQELAKAADRVLLMVAGYALRAK